MPAANCVILKKGCSIIYNASGRKRAEGVVITEY
jgi:hypothetical protein